MISSKRKREIGKADQKVNRMLGVSSSPPPTRSRTKSSRHRNAARGSPCPRNVKEYQRFSFLDAEERARLSMPSFLASSESANNPYNIIKHRKAKQQRE
jgi:hypothetical protein